MPLLPVLDGNLFALTSAHIDIGALTVRGVSNLARSEEMKFEVEAGSDGLPLGAPGGIYAGTLSFEIVLAEFAALTKALGPGYKAAIFSLGATYLEVTGDGIVSFFAPKLRITKDDWTEANDGKASRVKVECASLAPFLLDGLPSVLPGGGGGVVGTVASIVSAVGSAF